jgi:hypothetical protein
MGLWFRSVGPDQAEEAVAVDVDRWKKRKKEMGISANIQTLGR